MTESDLLGLAKATSEIAQPLKEFLNKLFGPAAEEAGELLADRIRFYRWRNANRIFERAQEELRKKNITPHEVPLKTLMPIFEGASLEGEENNNLQSKWTNLLVTAASGNSVHPSYPKILSELIQPEAMILDHLFPLELRRKTLAKEREKLYKEDVSGEAFGKVHEEISELSNLFYVQNIRASLSFEKQSFSEYLDNLIRLRLCEHPEEEYQVEVVTNATLDDDDKELEIDNESVTERRINYNIVRLTALGRRFTAACQGLVLDELLEEPVNDKAIYQPTIMDLVDRYNQ